MIHNLQEFKKGIIIINNKFFLSIYSERKLIHSIIYYNHLNFRQKIIMKIINHMEK